MRNKNLLAIKPWSAEESLAFDHYIAEQDARIRDLRSRYRYL